jgi:hypothetical protein
MELRHQNTAADLLTYLPVLKQKFTDLVGETNQMEQILIDSAFENYDLYLSFRKNDNAISVESTQKMKNLGESDHLQMASMALYYNKITAHFKQGSFIEIDTQLLREIFQFYRDSMLHFKFQKVAFKTIKASLSHIVKA